MIKLYNGDSAEILKQLPENSIDSIVTDPPAAIAFMSKTWDGDKGGRQQWIDWLAGIMQECLRVLKPGGHAFVWSLPRTSHWTATALEDAGFEIRDVVAHLQSQGFPKSMNVSKAIDKHLGNNREVIGLRPDAAKLNKSVQESQSGWVTSTRHPELTAPGCDESAKWEGWGTALKPSSEFWILCRKPLSEKTVAANVLKWNTGAINIEDCRVSTTDNLNGGAHSNTLKDRDDGWGMKTGGAGEYVQPSGRWPANCVLTHAEGCTLEGTMTVKSGVAVNENRNPQKSKTVYGDFNNMQGANQGYGDETVEKWNCVDGCPVKLLNEQSGTLKSGTGAVKKKTSAGYQANAYGKESRAPGTPCICYGDEGGGSRFFKTFEPFIYKAKAPKSEKNEGLADIENNHPCLLPGELVHTAKGLIEIENTLDKKLYTINGTYNEAKDVFSSPYKGDIYSIRVDGTNVTTKATNNHPFLVWKVMRKKNSIIGGNITWELAESIHPGDYLLTPTPKETEEEIHKKSDNWWFVAGLWLAEGSISGSGDGLYPCFTLSTEEKNLISRISEVFPSFGVYEKKEGNAVNVVVFDRQAAKDFVVLCGKGAKRKFVSDLVLSAPKTKRLLFLNGYLAGDGCIVRGDYRAKTASISLAATISILADSIGYKSSWYEHVSERECFIGNRKIKQGKYYQIYLSRPGKPNKKPRFVEYEGNQFSLKRVKEITKTKYDGLVWNATVEPTHTFQTIVGMSHNTVKSVGLCEYFATMITPPGGIVLDPFMGSGSTGLAAIKNGFGFVGIEMDENYFKIAEGRIHGCSSSSDCTSPCSQSQT